MKTPVVLAAIATLGIVASPALAEKISPRYKAEVAALAKRLQAAMKAKDSATIVALTPPPIVKLAGGGEKMLELLKAEDRKNEEAGLKDLAFELKPQDQIYFGDVYRIVFLESVLTAKVRDRSLRIQGYQIAMAEREGDTWYVLDGTRLNEKLFRGLFKGMPEDLKLPEIKRTVK